MEDKKIIGSVILTYNFESDYQRSEREKNVEFATSFVSNHLRLFH